MAVISSAGLAMAQQARPAAAKPILVFRTDPKLGKILYDRLNGFTLYHLNTENTGKSVCPGITGCLGFWPPFLLPNGMKTPTAEKGLHGKLGFIKRKGVGKQITYDGWALYNFKGDKKPTDTNGNSVNASFGDWRAVAVAPMVKFTVNITNTGVTWGTVKLQYAYRGKAFTSSCNSTTCSFLVHAGVKVQVSETPTSSTWPFTGCEVQSVYPPGDAGPPARSGKPDKVVDRTTGSSSTSIVVKSNDNYSITATYVPA